MDHWYTLSLGDGVTAPDLSDEVVEQFQRVWTSGSGPSGMAVFTRPESEGRLYCEIIAYFSPATAEVAKKFDARPCQKPVRDGLKLLAGDETAWSILFSA